MIHIPYDENKLKNAMDMHAWAVRGRVSTKNPEYRRQLFQNVGSLTVWNKPYEENNFDWLDDFILSDVERLKTFAEHPEALQFKEFKEMYASYFSHSPDTYLFGKYNAYTFVKNLGVTICPYCDEEYLNAVKQDGKPRRTFEIDHFYSKSKYPALAMCFFNLVPSGQNCNGLKLEKDISKNPYESDIESHTRLYPDLPIGVNMDIVKVEDCTIHFHQHEDMTRNVEIFALEDRYKAHRGIVRDLLRKKQFYSDEKLEEMVRCGFFRSVEEAKRDLFGEDSKTEILGKLRRDLLGNDFSR